MQWKLRRRLRGIAPGLRAPDFLFMNQWMIDIQYLKVWNQSWFKLGIKVTKSQSQWPLASLFSKCKASHPVEVLLILEHMLVPLSSSTKLPLLKSEYICLLACLPIMDSISYDSTCLGGTKDKPRSGLLHTLITVIQPFSLPPLWTAAKSRFFKTRFALTSHKPAESLQSNSRPLLTQLMVHLGQKTQTSKYVPHTFKISNDYNVNNWTYQNTTYTCRWHPSRPSFVAVSSSKPPTNQLASEGTNSESTNYHTWCFRSLSEMSSPSTHFAAIFSMETSPILLNKAFDWSVFSLVTKLK